MKRFKKTSLKLAMIGGIIGIMMTIIYSQSTNIIAVIPIAGVVGALIGTHIDKNRANNEK